MPILANLFFPSLGAFLWDIFFSTLILMIFLISHEFVQILLKVFLLWFLHLQQLMRIFHPIFIISFFTLQIREPILLFSKWNLLSVFKFKPMYPKELLSVVQVFLDSFKALCCILLCIWTLLDFLRLISLLHFSNRIHAPTS